MAAIRAALSRLVSWCCRAAVASGFKAHGNAAGFHASRSPLIGRGDMVLGLGRNLMAYALFLMTSAGAPQAMMPPIYDVSSDELRRAFEGGATLVGHLNERLFVERYERGGELRGVYHGRAYQGRWRLDGARLCTEVAPTAPVCVAVKALSQGAITDGWDLRLLPVAGEPQMSVTYLVREPWLSRSPHMAVQVRMLSPSADSFSAAGTIAGLPRYFMVWAGRRLSGDRQMDVLIHGTTDGVTFTAERVTHPNGQVLP